MAVRASADAACMGMAPKKADSTMVIDDRKAAPNAKDYDATTGQWVAPKPDELATALQNPTLSDMLVRDLAAGQVRTMRKGGRRGTYSGTAQSPYSLPPLMG